MVALKEERQNDRQGAPAPAFTLTTCSRMEKAPDWTEIEMLLEMIGPAIQCMPSGVIHLLGARKLNWLKSLSTSYPIQPGSSELRLIEQAVNVRAPDQSILPHRSIGTANLGSTHRGVIVRRLHPPVQLETGLMGTGIRASHVDEVATNHHRSRLFKVQR